MNNPSLLSCCYTPPRKKKSQGVQNVPNRQLHATTKASKSFPDCSAMDQGKGEVQREETKAK